MLEEGTAAPAVDLMPASGSKLCSFIRGQTEKVSVHHFWSKGARLGGQ